MIFVFSDDRIDTKVVPMFLLRIASRAVVPRNTAYRPPTSRGLPSLMPVRVVSEVFICIEISKRSVVIALPKTFFSSGVAP